jgi:hypothetical protein
MRETIQSIVVGVPIANELTNQGFITALDLEQSVWLGMTYGAWFKVGMALSLTLLILEKIINIYTKFKARKSNKTTGI